MVDSLTTIDILKLLDKSNCGKCDERTCLAFAASVFKGGKKLEDCPNLEKEIIERYEGKVPKRMDVEQEREKIISELKKRISKIDLSDAAERLGAKFSNNTLTINCMGKDFNIDSEGKISTDIHVNPWVTIPILSYILDGSGTPVSGEWVPFRELEGGKKWYRLFGQRCEKPLKKVADTYADLFSDMLHIFNGRRVENHYSSDISLVLHPLPKLPILICYWKPEDDLESDLNLFFDLNSEKNLRIEIIYTLVAGLVIMFEKIALTHG
jgi:hypothetical protein